MSDPIACPECAVGKHGNCDGRTLDRVSDEIVPCPCAKAGHSTDALSVASQQDGRVLLTVEGDGDRVEVLMAPDIALWLAGKLMGATNTHMLVAHRGGSLRGD